MEPTTIIHGSLQPIIAEAINAIREHVRPFLGGVCLVLGLLTATSPKKSLLQALITLALIVVAFALFNASAKKGGAK